MKGSTRTRLFIGISIVAILSLAVAMLPGSNLVSSTQTNTINYRAETIAFSRAEGNNGGEPSGESVNGPAQEQYDDMAYPNTYIDPSQQAADYQSFLDLQKHGGAFKNNWQEVGPTSPLVVGPSTYTGRPTYDSGRVTALALSPNCHANDCKIFVGSAGGGVWEADNALVQNPNWHPSSNGIPSNAIGSIAFDPTDKKGKTLYVGTGEPNGSGDSESGVGLYRSTDFGKSWQLVPGSYAVSNGRSIGAVAVDPNNGQHIFIGTAVARHGSSSVNGGRYTPPGSPQIGLYESTDGGATFNLVFSQPSDTVNPGSPTGDDYFRGGVTNIQFYNSVVYFSMMDYGLYRSNGSGYEQVFASAGGGTVANSLGSRTEFSLAPMANGQLRIYVGDTDGNSADLYRVDNANVPASTLTNGTTNPGWMLLSDSTPGTPGYGSYNYCMSQCSYDMPVYSPPGAPNIVYIGGAMQYDEIFTSQPPSNGRAVQMSTDAGVHFTDMTNDTENPPLGMHPDQHAFVSPPDNPDVVIAGSDGGVVRTSGTFTDASGECSSRGISGANLADCQMWLSSIPNTIYSLNNGLATLQFQSVSINVQNPTKDLLGGTQDNGTWAYNGQGNGSWFESVGGDGGQSGTDVANSNIRMHTYYGAQIDMNYRGTDPLGWNWVSDVFNESSSFYIPLINDPKVSGTWFAGLQHVWRTQDNGGPQAFLEQYCNEFTGDYAHRPQPCGDWVKMGGPTLTGSAYGTDKSGSYVVAVARTPSDTSTMWVGTRIGRLFITKNADATNAASVTFTRIDTANTPTRFISGIAVDPNNPNHAFVSFSGYNAYAQAAGTALGHVFEVTYDPNSGTATWKDISYNIGDQPVTGLVRDDVTQNLFISTDFGVAVLLKGSTQWQVAAGNLPAATIYGLTIDSQARVVYAATHGRGIWSLNISR